MDVASGVLPNGGYQIWGKFMLVYLAYGLLILLH